MLSPPAGRRRFSSRGTLFHAVRLVAACDVAEVLKSTEAPTGKGNLVLTRPYLASQNIVLLLFAGVFFVIQAQMSKRAHVAKSNEKYSTVCVAWRATECGESCWARSTHAAYPLSCLIVPGSIRSGFQKGVQIPSPFSFFHRDSTRGPPAARGPPLHRGHHAVAQAHLRCARGGPISRCRRRFQPPLWDERVDVVRRSSPLFYPHTHPKGSVSARISASPARRSPRSAARASSQTSSEARCVLSFPTSIPSRRFQARTLNPRHRLSRPSRSVDATLHLRRGVRGQVAPPRTPRGAAGGQLLRRAAAGRLLKGRRRAAAGPRPGRGCPGAVAAHRRRFPGEIPK